MASELRRSGIFAIKIAPEKKKPCRGDIFWKVIFNAVLNTIVIISADTNDFFFEIML